MARRDTFPDRVFAVFLHSGPAAALALLAGSTDPATRWVQGAALGALGRYGDARRTLSPLTVLPARHGSLAASTLASHLRQLGRHPEARELDAAALAAAERLGEDGGGEPGVDTAADALFDARLGLAADAVGVLDVTSAQAGLAAAAEVPGRFWRRTVRLGWVGTEIALLSGDPERAVEAATAALAAVPAGRAPRHEAKCLLFLGASLDAVGSPSATGVLARAAGAAGAVDAVPLLWVTEALLATRARRRGDTRGWITHRNTSRAAVTRIGESLSENDKVAWMKRPDIAAIIDPGIDGTG